VGLSLLILLVEGARHHRPLEAALLVALVAIGVMAARWLLRDFRLHPANFPDPTPSHGLHFERAGAGRQHGRD
jgi:hypothetical protein